MPGKPWKVDITVLQHGLTPLEGITPRVRISSGDPIREFAAKPTGKPGVYRAEVVFPKAGHWDYVVLDGFNDQVPHTFPAVRDRRRLCVPGGAAPPPPAPRPPTAASRPAGCGAAGAALVLALAVLSARPPPPPARVAPRAAEPA